MARFRTLLLFVAAGFALAACRIDASVEIVAEENGSGTIKVEVTADARALELAPELADDLRLGDLSTAGWTVAGPEPTAADGLRFSATKPFDSAEQLPAVLAELLGEDVIFSDFDLSQTRTFAKTVYELTGRIDPTPPLDAFGDDDLTQKLEGLPLGRSIEDLSAEAGPSDTWFTLEFSFTLPDDVTSDTALVEGRTATWSFSYGDPAASIDVKSTIKDNAPRYWQMGAIAAIALVVLVLLFEVVRWVVTTLSTPKGRRRRAVRLRQKRAASREVEAARPRSRMLRLLVVDVHGVIVRPTMPLEGLLLPVIRDERPDIDPALVKDRHRKLVLGRLTPEEFWSDIGLGPIGHEVETRYLSSFRLIPGLHPFLDRMTERGLPVAVVGNQPREWGDRLRRMAALEDSVMSWLVSGEVGATLPEPPLFEATRRVLSVDLYDCLYLSSVPEYLDAAAELGMATAYFAASPADVVETSHTLVRGFDDLLRGRAASG